jgi:hypothetical protein
MMTVECIGSSLDQAFRSLATLSAEASPGFPPQMFRNQTVANLSDSQKAQRREEFHHRL